MERGLGLGEMTRPRFPQEVSVVVKTSVMRDPVAILAGGEPVLFASSASARIFSTRPSSSGSGSEESTEGAKGTSAQLISLSRLLCTSMQYELKPDRDDDQSTDCSFLPSRKPPLQVAMQAAWHRSLS